MRRVSLIVAVLAAAAIVGHEAAANRRRLSGRGSPLAVFGRSVAYLQLNLGNPIELFSADDRDNSNAFYRTYTNAPSVAIAPDGSILSAVRRAASHATADDAITLVRNRAGYGLAWDDRRSEVTFSNMATVQEFAAITTIADRMWMIGTDATLGGSTPRECWTAYSDDSGVTWTSPDATRVRASSHATKTYNIPRPGSHFTTCVNTGIYSANNGDLVSVIYWNDTSQTRYIAGMIRSTDNGVNWTVSATIADMGSLGTQLQFEEPGCLRIPSTSTHVCLLRVDNGPNPSIPDPNTGDIMMTRSTDDGATWSTPVTVFQGRGTPAILRLTNGTMIAATRSRGQTSGSDTTGFRGVLYYSLNDGVTWTYSGEFQNPIDGPDEMYGGSYQGAGMVEVRTNVAGVMSAQEVVATANTNSGLFWSEISPGLPNPDDFDYSASALMFPSDGSADLNMGTNDLLNGASAWTMTVWFRKEARVSVTPWVAADEVLIARNTAGQRHLDVRFQTSRAMQVLFGATLSTLATWTTGTNRTWLNNSQRTVLTLVFDGSGATNAERFRVYADGVEVTSEGTFSGTIPATMTAPTSTPWMIGSITGSNRLRNTAVDTLAIWPGTIATPSDALALWANGSPIDVGGSLLGPPAVLHQFDGTTDNTGTDTSWAVASQTGTFTYRTRSYARRYAPPMTIGNIAGTRAASPSAVMSLAVNAGDPLDSGNKTVCAWMYTNTDGVDFEGLAYRQGGSAPNQEPFYLLVDPLGICNGGVFPGAVQTYTFGIGQQGHGVAARCSSYDTSGTPHFICGRYAQDLTVTATRGFGSVFVDGVDETIRYSTGFAVPATTGNEVPATITNFTTALNVSGLRNDIAGVGNAGMDTLMYFNEALTDAEILALYCATLDTRAHVTACDGVTATPYSTISGHANFVELWNFDNDAARGRSFTRANDLGNEANSEAAPALP